MLAAHQQIRSESMSPSRRSILAAAGAGLASFEITAVAGSSARHSDHEVAGLIQRSADSNAALMRGDIERYLSLITLTTDFTLMSPFGGQPTHAAQLSPERMQDLGRFFRNGTFQQEVVQSYASADLVVLVTIERAHVEVGGLPAQQWALRVTLVYRREAGAWRLAHRHADPLATGISLERAAALARGARE
jgi:ketosteroid isomerase-like protein